MSFNPYQWGAPMAPSAPTGPIAPGENPMLAAQRMALVRAMAGTPGGTQYDGAGSLTYGQNGPSMPSTMPTAFADTGAPTAPSSDYDTQIAQNQMRQRLALALMQNQKPAYGPLGALSNAIAGYYGGKNFRTAEQGELDISKARKADEAATNEALAKQFGLDLGGVPIDSDKKLQLAAALHAQQYAEQNPPLTTIPEGGTAIDRTGRVVATTKPKPRWVAGGTGEWMNQDDPSQIIIAADHETPAQKSDRATAQAVATHAGEKQADLEAENAAVVKGRGTVDTAARTMADIMNDPNFPTAVGPTNRVGAGALRQARDTPAGKVYGRIETEMPALTLRVLSSMKNIRSQAVVKAARDSMPSPNAPASNWYEWYNTQWLPNVNSILTDAGAKPLDYRAGPLSSTAGSSGPVDISTAARPKTKADYNQLPMGALFIDPVDGQAHFKGGQGDGGPAK